MRIAVIGSGISGVVCAHELCSQHDVVLYEARPRLGGHTNTAVVDENGRSVAVDTGFIVFNEKTYPNFVALLRELGVDWVESDMSFSVSSTARDFEYNGHNLSTLFSQRRHLVSPRFYRMVFDIMRFYRQAPRLLGEEGEVPLLSWLEVNGYSRAFIDDHMIPMVRALWSTTRDGAARFPARFLVRFFDNHGFLQVENRPTWLTVAGGSHRYLQAFAARFRGRLRLATPVRSVRRRSDGRLDVSCDGETTAYDHVIFACHSDQALRSLEAPKAVETQVLGAIPYQRNEVLLHTDSSVMPRLRRSWASWNVHLDDEGVDGACLTYWMNSLQPLDTTTNYFVTLNHSQAVAPERVIRRETYYHPIFTPESVAAQARHAELIDNAGISYCGAYFRNGFHEDGVVSAKRVVAQLRRRHVEVAA
ncbi:MAG: FAD-dependent oxidoreductase [Deltaproteobacteria bacterium]|nr:FAD-dependent oxidoreductase [Deltaproteobacteria bacterium]